MREDKEIVLEAVKNKGIIVKYASQELKNDLEVGLAAISQDKSCYQFLGEDLKENEEIQRRLEK